MIIDSHAHLGYDVIADLGLTEEELISACKANGIGGAIVQPLITRPYLDDTREIHDRIHRLCTDKTVRFWGMISMNPHFRPEDYDREAERCVRELGFVGIKLVPNAHGVNPSKRDGIHVFEVARKLGVPVMVHTGSGTPLSDPMALLPAARQFPEVKIVLAHAGSDLMAAQATFLAQEFENVYIEPSWLSILALGGILKAVGAKKIMFSSDIPANLPVELAKFKALAKDGAEFEQLTSRTAMEVFNLAL